MPDVPYELALHSYGAPVFELCSSYVATFSDDSALKTEPLADAALRLEATAAVQALLAGRSQDVALALVADHHPHAEAVKAVIALLPDAAAYVAWQRYLRHYAELRALHPELADVRPLARVFRAIWGGVAPHVATSSTLPASGPWLELW